MGFLRSGSKAKNPQFGADFYQLTADFLCSSDLLAEVAVTRTALSPANRESYREFRVSRANDAPKRDTGKRFPQNAPRTTGRNRELSGELKNAALFGFGTALLSVVPHFLCFFARPPCRLNSLLNSVSGVRLSGIREHPAPTYTRPLPAIYPPFFGDRGQTLGIRASGDADQLFAALRSQNRLGLVITPPICGQTPLRAARHLRQGLPFRIPLRPRRGNSDGVIRASLQESCKFQFPEAHSPHHPEPEHL